MDRELVLRFYDPQKGFFKMAYSLRKACLMLRGILFGYARHFGVRH